MKDIGNSLFLLAIPIKDGSCEQQKGVPRAFWSRTTCFKILFSVPGRSQRRVIPLERPLFHQESIVQRRVIYDIHRRKTIDIDVDADIIKQDYVWRVFYSLICYVCYSMVRKTFILTIQTIVIPHSPIQSLVYVSQLFWKPCKKSTRKTTIKEFLFETLSYVRHNCERICRQYLWGLIIPPIKFIPQFL